MSQPSRPRGRGPALRRRRGAQLDPVAHLEERQLLAPFVSLLPRNATFTAFPQQPNTQVLGTITVTTGLTNLPSQTGAANALPAFPEASAITSVTQLTPNASFGGDIVRIEAGPGGEFGKGVYAVSRGAGENLALGAINRPGVVYRVDPATGKASVFFDLNTVIPQLDPTQSGAANSVGTGTGLVNWYDITFDNEGIFDGRPSMFISSADFSNAAKNAIYRVASDGTFLGAFTTYSDTTLSLTRLTFNPTAILVPPVEQQNFLRGLVAGTGSGAFTVSNTTGASFASLVFDANQFRNGTPLNSLTLPAGVKQTGQFFGPQTGLTAANTNYPSLVYDTFTDFGVPNFPVDTGNPFPATPGLSGVQGLGGDLLINLGFNPNATTPNNPTPNIDLYPIISTNYRRFQDTAFDQFGFFSQGLPVTALTGTRGLTFSGAGTVYAGSLFVADLASGLSVSVAQPGIITGSPPPLLVPVQGGGSGGTFVDADGTVQIQAPTGNLGGRIVRIDQSGRLSNFAEGFNTSGAYDSSSFESSSLSITFSADGTTLYASDDDGIWQFKTVASLAGSTTGSIIGLNDLRTLGVPYEGQNSAIHIVDTGVDATNTNFRGRVATGTSTTISNAFGNDDFAAGFGGVGAATGGGAGNNTATSTPLPTSNGHGTPVAGVIAQFVPQATLNPVNVFTPFVTGGATTGAGGGNNAGGSFTSNQATSIDAVFSGLQAATATPYVKDPVRPLNNDRVIAASLAFGTSETFASEGTAYKAYPQVVISFKSQLHKLLKRGIAPIAAAGQFGATSGAVTAGGGAGGGGGTVTGNVVARGATDNVENTSVGDVNGMSLPAVLNEVISVTGSYPFPYSANAASEPTDPASTLTSRSSGPVLVFGNTFNTPGANTGTVAAGGINSTANGPNNLGLLTAAEGGGGTAGGAAAGTAGTFSVYSDRIMGAANRNSTTDFAAPFIDVPTFNRRYVQDGGQQNVFTEGGTSLSSAIVTGAYALVASALDYWTNISKTGATADAYLTQPVGARTLDFGKKSIVNFKAYNNPDGINGILAYTAVPATDVNDGLTAAGPPLLLGSTLYRSFARVDVGNAIAAIEGEVALSYLLKHGTFSIIDTNHNDLITSQEVQNFVDNANGMGLPEAGAMARLLGGTGRAAVDTSFTAVGEQPDQPDVLQRRYNFFDYAADGLLNGAISVKQLKMLQRNLLPTADQYTIVDRPRASANGFLIAPTAQRNFRNIQKLSPNFQFASGNFQRVKNLKRFGNVSPAQFGVNRGLKGLSEGPLFTLFDGAASVSNASGSGSATTAAADTATKPTTAGNATSTSTTTTTAKRIATPADDAPSDAVAETIVADATAESTSDQLLDAMKKLAAGGSTAADAAKADMTTTTKPIA